MKPHRAVVLEFLFSLTNRRTKESRVSFYAAPRAQFSLKHFARMAVRRHVTTPDVDRLQLPVPLREYLKYQHWNWRRWRRKERRRKGGGKGRLPGWSFSLAAFCVGRCFVDVTTYGVHVMSQTARKTPVFFLVCVHFFLCTDSAIRVRFPCHAMRLYWVGNVKSDAARRRDVVERLCIDI